MSGDLKWNKIFGAGLATALLIIGLREVTAGVFHTEKAEKMGWAVEPTIEAGAEGGGAAADLPIDWGTVLPTADVAAGANVFKKCAACHTDTSGGPNGIGPNLWGVVGRAVAGHAGFAYSDALKQHAGETPTWDYDALDAFLRAPGRVVNGTKMSFAGLKKQEDRIAVIAYLRSQGSTGYPIPAPDPARQAAIAAAAAGGAPATAGAPAPSGSAPTEGAEGAAGMTTVEGAQSDSAPSPSGVGGGMAGQAPTQGPGAAPTQVKPSRGGEQGNKGPDAVRPSA
jgi:cytochrome c